jgi:hypothetical protein
MFFFLHGSQVLLGLNSEMRWGFFSEGARARGAIGFESEKV